MNVYLKPVLSEKSHMLSHSRTYMFEVPLSANKQEVARAVEAQYEVGVTSVRLAHRQGKVKGAWQRKRRNVMGSTSERKRAYVSLKEGDNLPFFEAEHDHDHDHSHDEKPKKAAKESK